MENFSFLIINCLQSLQYVIQIFHVMISFFNRIVTDFIFFHSSETDQ